LASLGDLEADRRHAGGGTAYVTKVQ